MVDIDRIKLIKKLDDAFISVAIEDIKRALNANTTLAVFILGSCFIEALAGFYCGQTNPNLWGKSRNQFIEFATKYLTKYNAQDLWGSLRNGLVHSYTDKGKFLFVNKKGEYHFSLHDKRGLMINDEDFVKDLENAYKKFKKDIVNNNDVFLKVQQRFNAFGVSHISNLLTSDIKISDRDASNPALEKSPPPSLKFRRTK